ncbi:MAG: sulfatase-like hydrolase/transferase [Verrucomicrobiales bacterium]|nr:sulfatase-like hydrolase/transferase [Verrucomicrobiales bacterium]
MMRALCFTLLLGIAEAGTNGQPPNVLFLLADDLRADLIDSAASSAIETPNLDELAGTGMTFTRAYCSYPICVVSRAEILTGQHGWENGIDGTRGATLRGDPTFWPEAFREAGYETFHVGKWHVSGRPSAYGYTDVAGHFGSGGAKWWEPGQTDWKGFPITGYKGWIFQSGDGKTKYPELGIGVTPDISKTIAEAAIGLLEQERSRPWMMHVNFTAPHDPLMMPPGLEGKHEVSDIPLPADYLPVHPFDHGNFDGRDEALLAWPRTEDAVRDLLRVYYSVVDDLDTQIGAILRALDQSGQRENTIIIFTSDHGMACGSHGLRGKQNQYEHTARVPMIIDGPSIEPGHRRDAMIYLRELFPTTCDLAGIDVPDSVTAKSFAPILRMEEEAHHDAIFGYFTNTQRMIRTDDDWKLIVYPEIGKTQLFDLGNDPFEREDLSESKDEGVKKKRRNLGDRLREWRRQQHDI